MLGDRSSTTTGPSVMTADVTEVKDVCSDTYNGRGEGWHSSGTHRQMSKARVCYLGLPGRFRTRRRRRRWRCRGLG